MFSLQKKAFCVTGTFRDNRMTKCYLISLKSLAKTERGTSDTLFDKANKVAAFRYNGKRVVPLLTKVHSKVQCRVNEDRKVVNATFCVTSYDKYKKLVGLFYGQMEN